MSRPFQRACTRSSNFLSPSMSMALREKSGHCKYAVEDIQDPRHWHLSVTVASYNTASRHPHCSCADGVLVQAITWTTSALRQICRGAQGARRVSRLMRRNSLAASPAMSALRLRGSLSTCRGGKHTSAMGASLRCSSCVCWSFTAHQ